MHNQCLLKLLLHHILVFFNCFSLLFQFYPTRYLRPFTLLIYRTVFLEILSLYLFLLFCMIFVMIFFILLFYSIFSSSTFSSTQSSSSSTSSFPLSSINQSCFFFFLLHLLHCPLPQAFKRSLSLPPDKLTPRTSAAQS